MKLRKPDKVRERLRAKRELLVLRNGKFVPKEGASEKVVAPQLRALPSEIVTHEDQDGTKAHELDSQHIVAAVKQEWDQTVKEEQREKTPEEQIALLLRPTLTYMPLTQYNIDFVKWRVQLQLIKQALQAEADGLVVRDDAVYWLHFPERDLRKYSLKVGQQPKLFVKADRHLRDFNLTFRVFGPPPPAVVDTMQAYGVNPPNVRELVEGVAWKRKLNQQRQAEMNRMIYERLTQANSDVR